MFRLLRILRNNIIPVAAGFGLCFCIDLWTAPDPNSDLDPQAQSNRFCERTEVAHAAGGNFGWTAVAYSVNCDTLGNSTVQYIYLLQPGQIVSKSTLLLSYQGSEPELHWENKKMLSIRVKQVQEIWKQVVRVGGITVACDVSLPPD